MSVKHMFAKARLFPCSLLALLALSLLALAASPNAVTLASTSSVSALSNTSLTSVSTQKSSWQSFVYGYDYTNDNAGIVLHQKAFSSRSESLTQYVVPMAQYYPVSPDGKNVAFSQVVNGMRQYWTAVGPYPASGFFYEGTANANRGNVLWTSDNRNVLVLDKEKGVSLVDTQTGKAHQVLSLPYRAGNTTVSRIESLVFYRDGYIYFHDGRGGPCALVLCRASLTGKAQITQLTTSSVSNDNYLMSPDGKTIYYRNLDRSRPLGIYAVNVDGTKTRLVRSSSDASAFSSLPVGFGAHNALIVIRRVGTKFQLVQLGATSSQDRVLVANVANGATSLCDPNNSNRGFCSNNILLSPDAQSIVVYGVLSNGHDQFWTTNVQTGQQQVIAPINTNLPHRAQLLGWDVMPFCNIGC